jgi:hypothetical protein
MNLPAYLAGIVADNICCQMLCRHSLASEFEAAKTINGDAIKFSFSALNRMCRAV